MSSFFMIDDMIDSAKIIGASWIAHAKFMWTQKKIAVKVPYLTNNQTLKFRQCYVIVFNYGKRRSAL